MYLTAHQSLQNHSNSDHAWALDIKSLNLLKVCGGIKIICLWGSWLCRRWLARKSFRDGPWLLLIPPLMTLKQVTKQIAREVPLITIQAKYLQKWLSQMLTLSYQILEGTKYTAWMAALLPTAWIVDLVKESLLSSLCWDPLCHSESPNGLGIIFLSQSESMDSLGTATSSSPSLLPHIMLLVAISLSVYSDFDSTISTGLIDNINHEP